MIPNQLTMGTILYMMKNKTKNRKRVSIQENENNE